MIMNFISKKCGSLLILVFSVLIYSCKSSDEEVPHHLESRLMQIQTESTLMPVQVLEFSEDGRPISETNRTFIYDANRHLIESTEDTGRFILSTYYSYSNDKLIRYDTPAIGSSDAVIRVNGEITYEDLIITRTAIVDGEIQYLQKYTFLSDDYRHIARIEGIPGANTSLIINLFDYEYDADFNLVTVKEFEINPITSDPELKYTYTIEYDEMKNPFFQFMGQNPIVYGLMSFSFDTSTLSVGTAIDPMVRRNGQHNITKVTRTNTVSGSTFLWNFDYVYNVDGYPIEKKRIDENGDFGYTSIYSYY